MHGWACTTIMAQVPEYSTLPHEISVNIAPKVGKLRLKDKLNIHKGGACTDISQEGLSIHFIT